MGTANHSYYDQMIEIALKEAEIRLKVADFRTRTANGELDQDCFAPWYIQQEFAIPDGIALEHSSTNQNVKRRNYDFGLDAFHIVRSPIPTTLVLVQAKFSDSVNYIAKGFGDFENGVEVLASLLKGREVDIPIENSILFNLHAELNKIEPSVRSKLRIDFRVIHLSDLDKEILLNRTETSRSKLKDAIRKKLGDFICQVDLIGPGEMGPAPDIVVPPARYPIKVSYLHPYDTGKNAKMYFGMAKLADFVRMYETRRENLFSRNIRYYIKAAKNTKTGPAGKIKETLSAICVENPPTELPHMFAAYHNGISLYTSKVYPNNGDSNHDEQLSQQSAEPASPEIYVNEPYILNGCQTIKSAYYFKGEKEDLVNPALWEEIEVPLRIVETDDDEVVRTVTLSNNFQNAVDYSALHANDDDQIKLQRRFEACGVFYERQKGAFDSLVRSRPELFEDKYSNTKNTYIDIVGLAQAIMATAEKIPYANHPSRIFETKSAYDQCFQEKKTSSIALLIFLYNLFQVMPRILKHNLDLEDLQWKEGSTKGPPPSRFVCHTVCLLARYLAKENMDDVVKQYGQDLCWSTEPFRTRITGFLRKGSGIRVKLASFMKLEDNPDIIKDAFDEAKRELRLGDYVDPFDKFRSL